MCVLCCHRKTRMLVMHDWQGDEPLLSEYAMFRLMDKVLALRQQCGFLTVTDWINIPLVYTQASFVAVHSATSDMRTMSTTRMCYLLQIAKLATYGYFAVALISRQTLRESSLDSNAGVDLHFPFLTTLEFFFYVGWLKVGEQMLSVAAECYCGYA